MITTVFLDVDNTLLDFSEGSRRCMAEGFRAFGIPYKDEMFSVFHTINSRLWHRVEDGTLTREELFEIRWNTIFEALGIQADGIAFEAEFRRQLRDSAIPMEGAEELLQYLHQKKYTLVIASNAVREQQVRRLTKAGLFPYIDLVATSEEAGYAKPKKEFFDYCLSLLPPETTPAPLMVGQPSRPTSTAIRWETASPSLSSASSRPNTLVTGACSSRSLVSFAPTTTRIRKTTRRPTPA